MDPPEAAVAAGLAVPDIHPMEAKKQLAHAIVERYHSREAAEAVLTDFNVRFSKRDLSYATLPEVTFNGTDRDMVSVVVTAFARGFSLTKSRGEARRLIEQGSVQLRGEKIMNPVVTVELAPGDVLKLDKTHAVRVASGE